MWVILEAKWNKDFSEKITSDVLGSNGLYLKEKVLTKVCAVLPAPSVGSQSFIWGNDKTQIYPTEK